MDNNTKQTNNDQQTTNSTQPVTNNISQQDTPPVLAVEDVVPPMPQVGIPQKEEDKTTQVDKEEAVDAKDSSTSSGSAAPSDDIQVSPVVIGTTPKKKFGSGKVIATILGLFLLVGGLGAGTMLVQQNQDIRERAGACGGGCGGGGQCAGDLDGDGGGDCVPRGTTDEEIEAALEQPGLTGLDDLGAYEPAGDVNDNKSLPNVGDYGTEQTWNEWQNEQQGISSNNTSGVCTYASIIANVGVQECTEAPIINESNCPGCTIRCGTERCDVVYRDGSQVPGSEFRISASAGGSTTTTGGGNHQEETPPTTPPTITATCQNVKAYSTSWTELTTAQLSALTSNTTVNFCVTGALTGGSFTKARFTINGVLQPETTTVRPSSTDFCQSYVIPAGVTSHNVTAQIYHNSLGWK